MNENEIKEEPVTEEKPATEKDAAEETINAEDTAEVGSDEKNGKPEKRKVRKLEAELADAKKKNDDLTASLTEEKDKYMRMLAEYDNFRRRSAKEKEGIYADAYADAVKYILPIIDNLERAAVFKDAESVSKGIEMILKSAEEALSKMGIEESGKVGESFDPNFHNAVMHVEDETLDSEVIVEVFQKGYVKDGKVIRPAMVKVAN